MTVPDLPGCFSAGDTLDEAIESAHEAITCHLEGLLMDGQPIPEQAPLEVHQFDRAHKDGLWVIVPVDMSKLSSKAKRVNITTPCLPECWLLWMRPLPGRATPVPGC